MAKAKKKSKPSKEQEEIVEGPVEPTGKLIFARECKVGEFYLDWNAVVVIEALGGRKRQSDGTDHFTFRGRSTDGMVIDEYTMAPHAPILVHPQKLKVALSQHERMRAILENRAGAKVSSKPTVVVRTDPDTGEIVEYTTKKAKAPRDPNKPRVPRSNIPKDPKTGCTPGTKGHMTGEVILSIKPGANFKQRAIEAMMSKLQMPKTAASMWFMDHTVKRPAIYGKFAEAK